MNLREIAIAWMLTIAVGYFSLAILDPTITGDTTIVGAIFYGILGVAFLAAATLPYTPYKTAGRILQFILGVILALGAIESFISLAVWNVPFVNVEVFQVGMALLNVLTAVFAFSLAVEKP